ncbi:MAG: sigma-54 dependent transcriptional regulator [Desulfosoma sp.]
MAGETFQGFFLVDSKFNIVHMNEACKQSLGIGNGFPSQRWSLEKLFKALQCSITPRQLVADLRRASGKSLYYQGRSPSENQVLHLVLEQVPVKGKMVLVGLIHRGNLPSPYESPKTEGTGLMQWIVDGLRDGFFVVEARSKIIVYANEAFHLKRGLRPPLAVGKRCYQAVLGLVDSCSSMGRRCPLESMDSDAFPAFCPNGEGSPNGTTLVRLTPLRHDGEGFYVAGMEWASSERAFISQANGEAFKAGERTKTTRAPTYIRLQEVVSKATRAPTLKTLLSVLSQAVHQDVGPMDLVFVLPDAAGKDYLVLSESSNISSQELQNLKNMLFEAKRSSRHFDKLRDPERVEEKASALEAIHGLLCRWAAPRNIVSFGLFDVPRKDFAMYVAISGVLQSLSDDLRGYMDALFSLSFGAVNRLIVEETAVASPSFHEAALVGRDGIIGRSKEMLEVFELIDLVAASDATVLITGENGTGKELVAHAIHQRSHRKKGPFVVAHCSAYSPTLLESELFGHEKGAFTGAIRRKMGRIERAQGGTLFLDEIGDIAPATQVLLLRFLQDHRFERVGGESTLQADVRVLAATNRNLLEEVESGRFRDDLYYRLNVISIHLPPLRQRKEDIPLLCHYFLKKYSAKEGKTVTSFSSGALQALMDYDWPGNVRQLENAVSHAVILAQEDTIRRQHLPRFLFHAHDPTPTSASLMENEKRLILQVLRQTQWNKHEAARKLQVSRSTLYSKIQRYGLRPENSV